MTPRLTTRGLSKRDLKCVRRLPHQSLNEAVPCVLPGMGIGTGRRLSLWQVEFAVPLHERFTVNYAQASSHGNPPCMSAVIPAWTWPNCLDMACSRPECLAAPAVHACRHSIASSSATYSWGQGAPALTLACSQMYNTTSSMMCRCCSAWHTFHLSRLVAPRRAQRVHRAQRACQWAPADPAAARRRSACSACMHVCNFYGFAGIHLNRLLQPSSCPQARDMPKAA